MNISKFLITSASALAIVGTVGVAVAQNGLTSTPNSDALTNPKVGATVDMQAAPVQTPSVMPASPMVNTETNMTTEREPRADRN